MSRLREVLVLCLSVIALVSAVNTCTPGTTAWADLDVDAKGQQNTIGDAPHIIIAPGYSGFLTKDYLTLAVAIHPRYTISNPNNNVTGIDAAHYSPPVLSTYKEDGVTAEVIDGTTDPVPGTDAAADAERVTLSNNNACEAFISGALPSAAVDTWPQDARSGATECYDRYIQVVIPWFDEEECGLELLPLVNDSFGQIAVFRGRIHVTLKETDDTYPGGYQRGTATPAVNNYYHRTLEWDLPFDVQLRVKAFATSQTAARLMDEVAAVSTVTSASTATDPITLETSLHVHVLASVQWPFKVTSDPTSATFVSNALVDPTNPGSGTINSVNSFTITGSEVALDASRCNPIGQAYGYLNGAQQPTAFDIPTVNITVANPRIYAVKATPCETEFVVTITQTTAADYRCDSLFGTITLPMTIICHPDANAYQDPTDIFQCPITPLNSDATIDITIEEESTTSCPRVTDSVDFSAHLDLYGNQGHTVGVDSVLPTTTVFAHLIVTTGGGGVSIAMSGGEEMISLQSLKAQEVVHTFTKPGYDWIIDTVPVVGNVYTLAATGENDDFVYGTNEYGGYWSFTLGGVPLGPDENKFFVVSATVVIDYKNFGTTPTNLYSPAGLRAAKNVPTSVVNSQKTRVMSAPFEVRASARSLISSLNVQRLKSLSAVAWVSIGGGVAMVAVLAAVVLTLRSRRGIQFKQLPQALV